MKLRVISILVSIGLLAGMLAATAGPAAATSASSTDWNYVPLNVAIQAGSALTAPNGIPLCTSKSLGSLVCYSPAFIKTAYNFPSGLDGTGQTIVIVDAYGSPTITSDLATFDSMFGIAPPPSFTIMCGTGGCPATPATADKTHGPGGWATETSLDVEYAHAMAPGANIVLDVASSSSGNAINIAEAKAIALYPGAIFSQSFGIPEAYIKAGANNAQVKQGQKNYAAGIAKGDTFFASAGDSGADFGFGFAMAEFPGSDLHNTSVTGTQGLPYLAPGTLTPCGSTICSAGLATYQGPCALGRTTPPPCTPVGYGGEQVWNEPSFQSATGGAPSILFGAPSYQAAIGLTARGPDVSYNAAIDGGVLVVESPYLYFVGGTSAGSPQWAGIAALANQARAMASKGPIGDLNPTLYSIASNATSYAADFHDITVGNDILAPSTVGYPAGTGYDLASGLGTPNVANLVASLAAH